LSTTPKLPLARIDGQPPEPRDAENRKFRPSREITKHVINELLTVGSFAHEV
jgi:hypothetical protein